MKTILLVRHADAHQGKDGLPDSDRPLVPKGEKNAKKMAKRLRKELVAPDLIISSPVERALATAHIFADILHYPAKNIILKADIYDNDTAGSFLEIIQNINNKHHTILFIGHEPTLSEFCSILVADFHASIPKTGVVSVIYNVDTWKEISKGKGEVALFDFPANKLKRSDIAKKFQIDLGENIDAQLKLLLKAIDPEVAKNIIPTVKKTSTKLAKRFVKAAEDYGDKALLYKITQSYCSKIKIKEEAKKIELLIPDSKNSEAAKKSSSHRKNENKAKSKLSPTTTTRPARKKHTTRTGRNVASKKNTLEKHSPKKPA